MRRTLERLSVLILLALVLPGCPNSYVTPADTSAANLDVKLVVIDTPTSSDGKNVVVMQFLFGGKPVQFAGTETASCNGVGLTLNGLVFGYAERVPSVPVGGTYHFVYTHGGVPTAIDLVVPPRVVFTSPMAGATLARNNNMTIHYVADGGSGVDAGGSTSAVGLARNVFEPDNGTYTGLDTTSLGTGAGTLSLTRRFETTPTGTGFHAVSTQYDSISEIHVTWT